MRFDDRIYTLLKRIPKGKVTTYKEISRVLNTKAYRAVGQALKRNPHAPEIPCHRVIRSDGSIGGYSGKTDLSSPEIKRKINLLRKEGVKINENKIDLEKYFFKF